MSDSGYIEVEQVKLYYEVHGAGEPLLYLHGGLGSSKDFAPVLPLLSEHFQVILVDRKGHGRSCDDGESFSYAGMARSMDAFLGSLGVASAHVIGWSDGGVTGLHLASRFPGRVKKLVAVGANYLVEGLQPDSIEWTKNKLTIENPSFADMEKEYRVVNPMPGNYPKFIRETQAMWLANPLVPEDALEHITVPTLLMIGDRDLVTPEHTLALHAHVKGSQLCILPDTSHFVWAENAEIAATLIRKFLKG